MISVALAPFIGEDDGPLWAGHLGPMWIRCAPSTLVYYVLDELAPFALAPALMRFIGHGIALAEEHGPFDCATAYAVRLDDQACPAGQWHVDTGQPQEDAAYRAVATWTSDGYPAGPEFIGGSARQLRCADGGPVVQPANGHVIGFHEGADMHRRPAVIARPGSWGVFASMSLYRPGQPVNLGCPRLEALRTNGPADLLARAAAYGQGSRSEY